MKHLLRSLIAAVSLAGIAAAQTVVTGTGKPDVDIQAVQAAVDRGGSVVLHGHFSFDNPPGKRGERPDPMAMVLVSREVSISGEWDERGEMTAIEGGEVPFAVEAPGAAVRIERLRFLHPRRYAIFVDAVSGLEIQSCKIESVEPAPLPDSPMGLTYAFGIYVSSLVGLPTGERPGNPGNVYGKLSILDNQASVNGTADEGMGIMVVDVGSRAKPVELDISGNTIRNATQKGINLKQIGGVARIERNAVVSSTVYTGLARGFIAGIHCGGTGSYLIAHNRIDMSDPNGAGIRLRSYPHLGAAIERATITDNEVNMSVAEDAVPGARSAGIEILGLARDNIARRNTIRGRARVALSVEPDVTGSPARNVSEQNDHASFLPSPREGGKHE